MVAVTGHASQLLDLHRESLARFEAVTLTQRLVNGRKTLSLLIEVPVGNPRRRRRPRNAKRKEKDRQRKREKKSLKEASPHPPPTAQPHPTLPSLPDSPIGWFNQTIPQLDGCGSAASDRSPAASPTKPAPRQEAATPPQEAAAPPQIRRGSQAPNDSIYTVG